MKSNIVRQLAVPIISSILIFIEGISHKSDKAYGNNNKDCCNRAAEPLRAVLPPVANFTPSKATKSNNCREYQGYHTEQCLKNLS